MSAALCIACMKPLAADELEFIGGKLKYCGFGAVAIREMTPYCETCLLKVLQRRRSQPIRYSATEGQVNESKALQSALKVF